MSKFTDEQIEMGNTMLMPPRLRHNKELYDAMKVPPRYPPVSEQAECLPIEREKLLRFGYNPTICPHPKADGMLMCYRFHPTEKGWSKLALVGVNWNGGVGHNQAIDIPGSCEDPHFFRWNLDIWISFVESSMPERNPKAVVKLARLNEDLMLVDFHQPLITGNDGYGIEKNWCILEHGGRLQCIKHSEPIWEVINLEACVVDSSDVGPEWPYGTIRGGTAPVPFDGKLLRFFHGACDTERGRHKRRYTVGAMLMEPEPPFTPIRISKRPILWGSEEPMDKTCSHAKPKVVFPGGVVVKDGKFWLSVGVNDHRIEIVRLDEEQLNL